LLYEINCIIPRLGCGIQGGRVIKCLRRAVQFVSTESAPLLSHKLSVSVVESLINKARRLIRSLGEIKIDKEYVIPDSVFC
jgi:hypothetical protein